MTSNQKFARLMNICIIQITQNVACDTLMVDNLHVQLGLRVSKNVPKSLIAHPKIEDERKVVHQREEEK